MTDLLELAARVESASGPDRELDAAIARATNWCPPRVNPHAWEAHRDAKPDYWFSTAFGMPAYTASLDAAMTLVPEGFGYIAGQDPANPSLHMWGLWPIAIGGDEHEATAATPALALTAACLRARHAQAAQGEGK